MPAPKGNQFGLRNKGGRPEEYTDEFLEKEAEAFLEWSKNSNNLLFKNFALERGYSPEYLSRFAKKNEEFRQAYERAKSWQEVKLVEGALRNKLNANFAKFLLINAHGWSNGQYVSHDTAKNAFDLFLESQGLQNVEPSSQAASQTNASGKI
jgi:hypothetical protein